MSINALPPAEVMLFHCSHCHAELSVPRGLQGVSGPCPCCSQQIQAPQTSPVPLRLPPPDGSPDSSTAPAPLPDLGRNLRDLRDMPAEWYNEGEHSHSPRQRDEPEIIGFRAKLAIPRISDGEDTQWTEHYVDDKRRASSQPRSEPGGNFRSNSKVWNVARTGLTIATGGLFAGLTIFLQDRQWVLDLPWRPVRPDSLVEIPAPPDHLLTRTPHPADPFLSEDPSDLEKLEEGHFPSPPLEARSMPAGASPIASGRKYPAGGE